jgi:hypothetical protein
VVVDPPSANHAIRSIHQKVDNLEASARFVEVESEAGVKSEDCEKLNPQ